MKGFIEYFKQCLKQCLKQTLLLNLFVLIPYTWYFTVKPDIYAHILFWYLLFINFYYYLKIEKLTNIIKDWEHAYSRQVKLNNKLTEEILKGEMKDD